MEVLQLFINEIISENNFSRWFVFNIVSTFAAKLVNIRKKYHEGFVASYHCMLDEIENRINYMNLTGATDTNYGWLLFCFFKLKLKQLNISQNSVLNTNPNEISEMFKKIIFSFQIFRLNMFYYTSEFFLPFLICILPNRTYTKSDITIRETTLCSFTLKVQKITGASRNN